MRNVPLNFKNLAFFYLLDGKAAVNFSQGPEEEEVHSLSAVTMPFEASEAQEKALTELTDNQGLG